MYESLLEMCIVPHVEMKSVFTLQPKKTTCFYDCKKCKACCNVFNIAFRDQKSTIVLFAGEGTHCFARKTRRDYETEKPSPFLKKNLRQSQPSTSEPEPKKVKMRSNMEKTYPFPLADNLSDIFIFQIILFTFSLQ